ncbi:MAG TPA: 7,8-didemethyl-8-hydroxy-5-deazariboflavin synthase subunit CofG, partial [Nitrosopumilaceae archaeon]|nr:7,8-didemethyl-8-hydroxy-5-deazariboflavin synthase subunit CofG [Nitrosopumilaceae archaeon]
MSKLTLISDALNRVIDNKEISKEEAYQIYEESQNTPLELYKTSQILRNKYKGTHVTYSRKIFFNLINLCRDTCSYCTYKSEPNQSKSSMMSKQDVHNLAKIGK